VARSTFSDANNGRPAGFFAAVFAHMYQRCLAMLPVTSSSSKTSCTAWTPPR
jgi:hypothetical protein